MDRNLPKSLICSNDNMTEGKTLKVKVRKLDMVPPLQHRILLKGRLKSVFQQPWQVRLPGAAIQLNSEYFSKPENFCKNEDIRRKKCVKKYPHQFGPGALRINPSIIDQFEIEEWAT